MSKRKKENNRTYCTGVRMPDVAAYVFSLLILGVYPLVYDDKYFNITITKYHFFLYSAGLYLALALVGYVVEASLRSYYHYESLVVTDTGKARFFRPEFAACIFLFANFFAWIVADNKSDAFYGTQGRDMGLCMYLVMLVMFVVLAQRFRPHIFAFFIIAVSAAFAFAVAVGQYMEHDFLHLRDGIAEKQYTKFISTFGNINMFAGFLSLAVPLFLAAFVFCKNLAARIVAGILLVFAGCSILTANSDSVFLGIAAGFAVTMILGFLQGRLRHCLFGCFLLFVGNLVLGLITQYGNVRYDKKRGGLAVALNRLDIACLLCLIALVIFAVVWLINRKYADRIAAWNKKKIVCITCIAGVLLVAAAVIGGALTGVSGLQFNDEWGSYRGYIWRKIVEVYGDAPLVNKVFGYGNESVRVTLKAVCYDEMVEVTGKVYDNAHNELLQYLFTTGIVGLASYLMFVISSFVYMAKHTDSACVCLCMAAATGYFAQSILNLNQPITTPFFFVCMAMGVGACNYARRCAEIDSERK